MDAEWRYLSSAVLLLLLEVSYFRVAGRLGIVDRPSLRGSSDRVTLRGGGIIFVVGAWIWFLWGLLGLPGTSGTSGAAPGPALYPWFMAGLTLIAAVSFADDVHPVSNGLRLTVQFAAMSLMFYEWGILRWELWWLVPVAGVVCVGITNAYNFMDGVNGMTGGYSSVVLVALMALNGGVAGLWASDFISQSFLITVFLSAVVFCVFNFRRRARCFAGDVGSVSMAFIVVFAIGRLVLRTGEVTYVMLLAVYGVDTVLTIIHRILLGERLGRAHRKHAYQLLANELRVPHTVVSLLYMSLQGLVSAGLMWLPVDRRVYSVTVLAMLCMAYIGFMRRHYHLHEEYLQDVDRQ